MLRHRQNLAVIVVVLLIAVIAFFSGGGFAYQSATTQRTKPTVIVSITAGQDDLFKIMAAFHLAQDAIEDGRHVILYFNARGVTVPVRRLEDDLRMGRDRPVWLMLRDLMNSGAEAVVAGESARVLGMVVGDFVPGVQIRAWSGKVFEKAGADAIVFTY